MNRHFKDAQYHIRQAASEIRRGLAVTLSVIRARLPRRSEEDEDDVMGTVRGYGTEARAKVDEVREKTAERIQTIR